MDNYVDLDELIAKAKARRAERQSLERSKAGLESLQQYTQQMPQTVGGSPSSAMVGGVQMNTSVPEQVNWAAPLAQIGSAFFQKRNEDKIRAAEEEERTAITEAIGAGNNDPELARLMKLAELGVPGVDRAIAARMAPQKKQPLAGLLQALPNLTPEAADALASEYNMDPAELRAMIEGAQGRTSQMKDEEFQRQLQLRQAGRAPRAPTEFELYQQNPEAYAQFQAARKPGAGGGEKFNLQAEMADALMSGNMEKFNQLKQVADAMKGRDQVDSVEYPLTPGQKSDQAKRLGELDKQISGSDQFMVDLKRAEEIVNKPKNFSVSQKAAWEAANSPDTGWKGSMERIIGSATVSPDLQELNAVFLSKTLDDMAKLGGGDSNEELRTIRSAYPNAMQDQRAAQALLKRLKDWESRTREKIWQRRQDIQSGKYYSQKPEDIVQPPVTNTETPAAPQIKIRSIR